VHTESLKQRHLRRSVAAARLPRRSPSRSGPSAGSAGSRPPGKLIAFPFIQQIGSHAYACIHTDGCENRRQLSQVLGGARAGGGTSPPVPSVRRNVAGLPSRWLAAHPPARRTGYMKRTKDAQRRQRLPGPHAYARVTGLPGSLNAKKGHPYGVRGARRPCNAGSGCGAGSAWALVHSRGTRIEGTQSSSKLANPQVLENGPCCGGVPQWRPGPATANVKEDGQDQPSAGRDRSRRHQPGSAHRCSRRPGSGARA
jgi:hypothetical protein